MKQASPKYDLITLGRSSIDLYSNDIGAPFVDIQNFAAYVGGSPTNIAVGANRLGVKTALLTGVGKDPVGDFILNFLRKEGVETRYITCHANARSSAVLLGIEPPDKFPLVFYRDNAADIQISIDDILAVPFKEFKVLEISGTALSKDPSRTATFLAAQEAKKCNATTVLDIDFRADQWFDPRAFGINIRALLQYIDIALGTEEEVKAAMLQEASQVKIADSQISAPTISGDLDSAIAGILELGPKVLIVKRGEKGASVYLKDGKPINVPGFPVEVQNVLGAGDAFASGFIYGFLQGWDWYKAVRMGNASGAIVVTRHGCANFMPYEEEALQFIKDKGGF